MAAKRNDETKYNLWLDARWHMPIDSQGYLTGVYYEGALGTIIKLLNEAGGSKALKIPRLLADTLRENAYIAAIVEAEKKTASAIFDDNKARRGLFFVEGGISVLQGKVQSARGTVEARKQDQQIIAMQLKKGRPPRFCGVRLQKKGKQQSIVSIPDKIEDCPLTDIDVLTELIGLEENVSDGADEKRWDKVVVLHSGYESEAIILNELSEYLEEQEDEIENMWFVCIPSIAYSWGSGTLHESLATNKCTDWDIEKILRLFSNLSDGLLSLHKRGYLHTDIRPANVMYLGEADEADDYSFIDYAGFFTVNPLISSSSKVYPGATGNTVLGTTPGGERNSPFYAPERRTAIEKESADAAIIVPGEDHFRIVFAWKSDILRDGILKKELVEYIRKFEFGDQPTTALDLESAINKEPTKLVLGDRIQVRDYIFDVTSSSVLTEQLPGTNIYKCANSYWKVYHGRIVIACDDELKLSWISIPRIIELQQWSAATDLYGLGALFLYTLYRKTFSTAKEHPTYADISFQRMLTELSNPNYFRSIWFQLSSICLEIPKFLDQELTGEQIKKTPFNPDAPASANLPDSLKDKQQTFESYAKYVAISIIHAIPETQHILANLENNCIYFLCSIFFVLCAIHRATALPESERNKNDKPGSEHPEAKTPHEPMHTFLRPFASSRLSLPIGPVGQRPADKAIDYIKLFKSIHGARVFNKFSIEPGEIEVPDNLPATILRSYYHALKSELESLRTKSQTMKKNMLGGYKSEDIDALLKLLK